MANKAYKFLNMFPLRHPQDSEKRILYLIKRAQMGEQYTQLTPPSVLRINTTASTAIIDSDENVPIIAIDTSSGTSTTYGTLSGAVDGVNVKFNTSGVKYETGTSQVYWQGQEQVRGVDYTESDPGTGEVTFTTAPLGGNVTVSTHKSDRAVDIAFATSHTGTDKMLITGAINGANKAFTVPGPYISGTLKVFLQGQLQVQGTGENWTETSPDARTFGFVVAPPTDTVVTATYEVAKGRRRYETTNDTLTFVLNSSNTTGTLSGPYRACSLELSVNGQLQTPGTDYIETDPAGCKFDTVEAWPAGGEVSVAYYVGSNADGLRNPEIAVSAQTGNYTATVYDQTVLGNATSGAITITLPAVANVTGMVYIIKKTDASANAVTVATTGAETIDGETTIALNRYDSLAVVSDGSNWSVI